MHGQSFSKIFSKCIGEADHDFQKNLFACTVKVKLMGKKCMQIKNGRFCRTDYIRIAM